MNWSQLFRVEIWDEAWFLLISLLKWRQSSFQEIQSKVFDSSCSVFKNRLLGKFFWIYKVDYLLCFSGNLGKKLACEIAAAGVRDEFRHGDTQLTSKASYHALETVSIFCWDNFEMISWIFRSTLKLSFFILRPNVSPWRAHPQKATFDWRRNNS